MAAAVVPFKLIRGTQIQKRTVRSAELEVKAVFVQTHIQGGCEWGFDRQEHTCPEMASFLEP